MYVIELTEDTYDKLAKHTEEMLRHGGKLMQCLEELKEGKSSAQRSIQGKRIQMPPYDNDPNRDFDPYEDPDMRYGRNNDYRMSYRPDYDRHPDREPGIGYRRY